MPRKEPLDTKSFDAEVVKAFAPKLGGTVTTQEERRDYAYRWCTGERESYMDFAEARGLVPVAFMVACLVDIEHPLITTERGTLAYPSLIGCAVRILEAELNAEVVHIPSKLVHTPCVQVALVHRQNAYAEVRE